MSEGSGRFQKGWVQGSCFLSILPKGVVGQPGCSPAQQPIQLLILLLMISAPLPFPVEISLFIPNQNTHRHLPQQLNLGQFVSSVLEIKIWTVPFCLTWLSYVHVGKQNCYHSFVFNKCTYTHIQSKLISVYVIIFCNFLTKELKESIISYSSVPFENVYYFIF